MVSRVIAALFMLSLAVFGPLQANDGGIGKTAPDGHGARVGGAECHAIGQGSGFVFTVREGARPGAGSAAGTERRRSALRGIGLVRHR